MTMRMFNSFNVSNFALRLIPVLLAGGLHAEPEANDRAFAALTRFLDALDTVAPLEGRPALDPLVLSFQLKLLWLSGYLPHVTSCIECGAPACELVGFSARAGGAVCGAHGAGLSDRARRDALAVVTASYEEHGGFRLRTVSA